MAAGCIGTALPHAPVPIIARARSGTAHTVGIAALHSLPSPFHRAIWCRQPQRVWLRTIPVEMDAPSAGTKAKMAGRAQCPSSTVAPLLAGKRVADLAGMEPEQPGRSRLLASIYRQGIG